MLIEAVDYNKVFSPSTIQTLKGKSGESLRQMVGDKTLMQSIIRSQTLLNQIAKAEAPYRPQLEQIAKDIIKKAYPIIDYSDIEIDAKIIQDGKVSISNHKSGDEDNNSPENAPDDTKRRLINAITQGASIRGAFAYLLFREALDKMDDSLVEKYSEILKLTFGVFDDEQAIALLLSMLAQGQKSVGGESEVEYNQEEDKFIIHATALNFPFLVHEIVKGLYEILAMQGFSTDKEKNKGLVKRVDKVENEPEDMQMGKFIYDALNNIYIDSDYNDPKIRDFLFTEIYKLSNNDFISFIENAINDKLTFNQKLWIKNTLRDIDRDLKKDATDLDDLD